MIPYQWYSRNHNRTVSPKSGIMSSKSSNFEQSSWSNRFAKNWDFPNIYEKVKGKRLLVTLSNSLIAVS